MIVKFETKSNRVKGLSFHPTRPWVLASLHIGVIQLWEYRMGTLLERFDEHEGPVRGVAFHSAQPLFVSGGDDYQVKVWNYKLRRCLFTLVGHLDYVRTVEFHNELPWILSASDDQTVRIWNWQSRSCVSVLTGHSHYVMCARFHPKRDMVVSASLDSTVRVWDISGLRTKSGPKSLEPSHRHDLFTHNDAVVKHVLEGHDRGVNWASFHPSLPLIISGADDRQIKLWRYNDSKVWCVDKFPGHFNNVSCVLFHPRQDLFISNSEDKSIRVWDIQKRTCLHTWRREHDRFWILAAHPSMNLFAAGHDTGMIVFKLERERPGYAVYKDTLFYVKDRYIRSYEFGTARDVPIMPIRRPANNSGAPPRSMSYNPAERAVLLTWDDSGGAYDLYQFPKEGARTDGSESKRGTGLSAVFVSRNRFAVLDASRKILIKNLDNEVKKRCTPPHATTDALFYAGTGCLLLRSENCMTLYDIQRRAAMKELTTPHVKYVYWSKDMQYVALLCKHSIILCTRKLKQLGVVHETIRVKSGVWDDSGVFIYTTLNHIKYCLPNGDSGIIRTLDVPIYLTKANASSVFALDREIKTRVIAIDPTEYAFKQALIGRNYEKVLSIIRSAKLLGKSIVAYLQKKGFPEVALHFVKDPTTRFGLAVECGNIDVALECAREVESVDLWQQLALEALRQGNHQVVEMAYQRTKSFAKLSFLYLITGNVTKLRKMLQIAAMRNDPMGRFHNALYVGNVEERVSVLYEAGQLQLAYLTAAIHGLEEQANQLKVALDAAGIPPPEDIVAQIAQSAKLALPPTPIMKLHESNWPLLTRARGYFDGAGAAEGAMRLADDDVDINSGSGWGSGSDDDLFGAPDNNDPDAADPDDAMESGSGDGWGSDSDLDLPTDVVVPSGGAEGQDGFFVPPTVGRPADQYWVQNSVLAADHAAAGSFETAIQLLERQIGAGNFAPLKPVFLKVFVSAHAHLPGFASAGVLTGGLQRNWESATIKKGLPQLPIQTATLVSKLQKGYQATTGGKFAAALDLFRSIIHQIPLLVCGSSQEVVEAKEMLSICREYILGLTIESTRKRCKDDVQRSLELMAYFTHCNLEKAHSKLTVKLAMKGAFKVKNYTMAAGFARRLLEMAPSPKMAQQARKVLAVCDKNPGDAITCEYDPRNPFSICAASMVPIYRGSPSCKCPYCGVQFLPEHAETICTICQIGVVDRPATGLVLVAPRR